MRAGAVIVAAGRSERMAGVEKMMALVAGTPLLLHSVRAFERADVVDEIVVVTRQDLRERVRELVDGEGLRKVRDVVLGGDTRAESSRCGLSALSEKVDLVLVHDGARPLVSRTLIERVAVAAATAGAAIPGVAPVATIKRDEGGASGGTLDRESLREAQTPQGFRRELLSRALAAAARDGFDATDEAACVERAGERVAIVPGDRSNIKVTVPDDLLVATALVQGETPARETRIGLGHDVHRLVTGRVLKLAGVEIPHPKGLEGHSDADVLAHAVCDALLGAASAGDLGSHFPDSDERWAGVSGRELLRATLEILRELGYVPVNVDVTVSAQVPRLAPHRARMIENLASALRLPPARVSVKFTTTERLGFEGREEGISASAVAMVERVPGFPEME